MPIASRRPALVDSVPLGQSVRTRVGQSRRKGTTGFAGGYIIPPCVRVRFSSFCTVPRLRLLDLRIRVDRQSGIGTRDDDNDNDDTDVNVDGNNNNNGETTGRGERTSAERRAI